MPQSSRVTCPSASHPYLDTEEAEDVSAGEADWVDALLEAHGTLQLLL